MKSKFIEKNMPAWFGRKSTKNNNSQPPVNHNHHQDNPFFSNNYQTVSDRKQKATSFDELPRGSPRVSRDFSASSTPLPGGSSGGFSGFGSDRIAHPLPQPSISPTTSLPSTTSFGIVDQHGFGSGSSSGGSSVSSAANDDPNNNIIIDHPQLGFFRLVNLFFFFLGIFCFLVN